MASSLFSFSIAINSRCMHQCGLRLIGTDIIKLVHHQWNRKFQKKRQLLMQTIDCMGGTHQGCSTQGSLSFLRLLLFLLRLQKSNERVMRKINKPKRIFVLLFVNERDQQTNSDMIKNFLVCQKWVSYPGIRAISYRLLLTLFLSPALQSTQSFSLWQCGYERAKICSSTKYHSLCDISRQTQALCRTHMPSFSVRHTDRLCYVCVCTVHV